MMRVIAMSILDRLKGMFRRKKTEGEVKYILKMKTAKGGWTKVAEFDRMITTDEFLEMAESGQIMASNGAEYRLDMYEQGVEGVKVVWGPVKYVVEEEEAESTEIAEERIRPRGRSSGLGALEQLLEELEAQAEVIDRLGLLGAKLAKLTGKGVMVLPEDKSFEDFIIDQMSKLKEKYDKLGSLFGSSKLKAEETEIPVEGKVPAWLVFGLKYAPQAVDQVLERVEQRLRRMGVLPQEGVGAGGRVQISPFPELESYVPEEEEEGEIREKVKPKRKKVKKKVPEVVKEEGRLFREEEEVLEERPEEVEGSEEVLEEEEIPEEERKELEKILEAVKGGEEETVPAEEAVEELSEMIVKEEIGKGERGDEQSEEEGFDGE